MDNVPNFRLLLKTENEELENDLHFNKMTMKKMTRMMQIVSSGPKLRKARLL
jgi:hypothetical protein